MSEIKFLKDQTWKHVGLRESHKSVCPQEGGLCTWICQVQRLCGGHRPRADLYSSLSLSLLPCCQNTGCTWVTWGGCTHPSFFYHICFFLPQSEVRWSCRQLRPKNCPPPQCPVRCSAPPAPFLKAGGPFW